MKRIVKKSHAQDSSFADALIDWQKQHGRHQLPWQLLAALPLLPINQLLSKAGILRKRVFEDTFHEGHLL